MFDRTVVMAGGHEVIDVTVTKCTARRAGYGLQKRQRNHRRIVVEQRLCGPLKKIAGPFNGPVAIGIFDDGTLCVVGPQDKPILIRNGAVMYLAEHNLNGDYVFSYFDEPDMG